MEEDKKEIDECLQEMTCAEQQMVKLFCSALIGYRDDKLAMMPVLMMLMIPGDSVKH